jgi:hypothetical protein
MNDRDHLANSKMEPGSPPTQPACGLGTTNRKFGAYFVAASNAELMVVWICIFSWGLRSDVAMALGHLHLLWNRLCIGNTGCQERGCDWVQSSLKKLDSEELNNLQRTESSIERSWNRI